MINDVDGPIARIVLKIEDKNANSSHPDPGGINRLWGFCGELLIISTQYHEGVHYAARPKHFIPIINHLQQLHRQNFVHGDIRSYNLVLKYDAVSSESDHETIDTRSDTNNNVCAGWLIDFDFGGKLGTVRYPKGYKNSMDDGKRPGNEGDEITIMDDWKSLIGLILLTYTFVVREKNKPTILQRVLASEKREELDSYCGTMADSNHPWSSDFHTPAKLLREYITITSDVYNVKPNFIFDADLRKCGLKLETDKRKASKAATGSPPK